MAFIIPWIFRAGTKAKSAEVNENFLAVKQFVDLLEEDVAANQIAVQTLEDTKANVNGNPTERFQVATAIVGNDAVNLNTLEKNTQNARGYIDGYRLSYSGKRVIATKGTCYSYDPQTETYEYLIKSNASIQSEILTLGGDATYYVFVCGDDLGEVYPALSVGTNNTTPSLPPDTNCWRRIGSFTTDEDGNIAEILNEGERSLLPYSKFPSWTERKTLPIPERNETSDEEEVEENGYIVINWSCDNGDVYFHINGLKLQLAHEAQRSGFAGVSIFPVSIGDEYKFELSGGGYIFGLWFIPQK